MIPIQEPGLFDELRTLLDVKDRECHWPLWNGHGFEDMGVCGKPALLGQPYCRHHCCIAFENFGVKK